MRKTFIISGLLLFTSFTSFAQQWAGSTTPASNINRDGNVAIGTTTPTAKLHVRGSLRFESLSLDNSAPRFLMMDGSGNASYKAATSLLANNCATTNFLTKRDANGNLTCSNIFDDGSIIKLGSQTTPPLLSFLDIYPGVRTGSMTIHGTLRTGGNFHMFTPEGATSDNWLWLINHNKVDNESDIWRIGSSNFSNSLNTGKGFTIYEGNSPNQTRFFIEDGTGKVGIGTTNLSCTTCDGYRLFVKDGIKTERIKVEIATTAGWADYVFEKDYKLPTLKEVEKQIKEKGHLADIPSAKEVVENGIELGEMNKLLLQKIEELTLYMIEQNKTNEKQAKEIEELKTLVMAKK